MAPEAPPKPLPVPDQRSEAFWAAAAEHRLVVQQCAACGAFAYPPVDLCGRCLAPERTFGYTEVAGTGRVRTWTVIRQAFLPGFAPDVPYIVAEIEIDGAGTVRMIGQLVDGMDGSQPVTALRIGAPVEVVFADVAPDLAVAQFRLVEAAR